MKLQRNSLAALPAVVALCLASSLPAVAEVTEAQIAAATTPTANSNPMVRHCERLVKDYSNVAADYRALATEHRGMAKDATK